MRYTADIRDILTAVSSEFGIPEEVITSPKIRTRPVTHARHLAIYLACTMTWRSRDEIATCFNQHDHSSLCHPLKKIAKLLVDGNEEVKKQVGALTQKLGSKKH